MSALKPQSCEQTYCPLDTLYYTIFPHALQYPAAKVPRSLLGVRGLAPVLCYLPPRQNYRGSVPRTSARYRPLVLMVKLCLTKSTAAHFFASLLDEIGLTLGSFWVDAWVQLGRPSHEKEIRTRAIYNLNACKMLNARVRI